MIHELQFFTVKYILCLTNFPLQKMEMNVIFHFRVIV